MRGNIELIAATLLAPAVVALVVAWLCRRLLPAPTAERYSLAVGLAAGFFVGYVLLPDDWAPLLPQRHWQWLSYLGLAAAIVGPVSWASGLAAWERWLLYALLAIAAAWVVVPTWETLQPPRMVLVPALAGYLLLLAGLFSALPDRLLGPRFVWLLTATGMATALAVAIVLSAMYCQVAMLAAAALGGCGVAGLIPLKSASSMEAATRALALPFTLLVGGMAFVGAIELDPPPILLLAPAAPLVLWLFAGGPLARFSGWKAAVLQTAGVLAILAGVLAWVALGSEEWQMIFESA